MGLVQVKKKIEIDLETFKKEKATNMEAIANHIIIQNDMLKEKGKINESDFQLLRRSICRMNDLMDHVEGLNMKMDYYETMKDNVGHVLKQKDE